MNTASSLKIIRLLKKSYPDAKCSLQFRSPLQLSIATILSAQSTDARVNLTTPELFRRFKNAKDFAGANQQELEGLIKSVGLFRNKAKNIILFAQAVVRDHKSAVPLSLPELQKLPGVGRKTANVIQSVLCDKADGIAVDTHVTRLSYRLGFTKHKDPALIEKDLMRHIPEGDWGLIPHLLISHGRAICDARNPECSECTLFKLCPRKGVAFKGKIA